MLSRARGLSVSSPVMTARASCETLDQVRGGKTTVAGATERVLGSTPRLVANELVTAAEPNEPDVAAAASSEVPSTMTVMVTAVEVAMGVATVIVSPVAAASEEVSKLESSLAADAFALRLSVAPTGTDTTKVTSVL